MMTPEEETKVHMTIDAMDAEAEVLAAAFYDAIQRLPCTGISMMTALQALAETAVTILVQLDEEYHAMEEKWFDLIRAGVSELRKDQE